MFSGSLTLEDRLRIKWAMEFRRTKQASKWKMFWVRLLGYHDWITDKDGYYTLHTVAFRGKVYALDYEGPGETFI